MSNSINSGGLKAAGFPFEDFSSLTRIEGKERACPSRAYGEPVEELDHGELRLANVEAANPELVFQEKELWDKLKLLSETCEEARYYHYLEKIHLYGCSIRELAASEEVSLGTIQKRIKSTVEFLKSKLV